MKILHSSDWHLGRQLLGQSRYQEMEQFLSWLLQSIDEKAIDVLLIAGDIFDTTTPSHRAQQLYYHFLYQVAQTCCQHVVIIGGNHDSPSLLSAPQQLLRELDIHVIAHALTPIEDEVIVLRAKDNTPQIIVCAVPYLRDKDLRQVEAGESLADKDNKLIQAIKAHYQAVAEHAKTIQQQINDTEQLEIPIIAMGHLFAAGGKVEEGDGVRDLYVGSLAHVTAAMFDNCFDYVALGHLHSVQRVAKTEHIRYSGSPIAMSFGEAGQQKQVLIADVAKGELAVNAIDIPCFQPLARLKGDAQSLLEQIEQLKQSDESVWLELIYTGTAIEPDLRANLELAVEGSKLVICRVQNKRIIDAVLSAEVEQEQLINLSTSEVFERCLDSHQVNESDRAILLPLYQEILHHLE